MKEFVLHIPEDELLKIKYDKLFAGIRDIKDPVTWRTLAIDLRAIMGSGSPEWQPPALETLPQGKELIKNITAGTYLAPLQDSIVWATYGEYGERKILPPEKDIKPIDFLLVNGRHKTQELFWKLADALLEEKHSVAAINPIGNYNDMQTRMVVPDLLVSPVKHAVFLSSTQYQDGGDLGVLVLALRALRNPNFAYMVDKVDIIMPMFGGSRGHKPGQSRVIGFEALETIYHPKDLIETVGDIETSIIGPHKYRIYRHVRQMKGELKFPKVNFYTIDIHNDKLPAKKFREARRHFVSLLPTIETTSRCLDVLSEKKLDHLPIRIVTCDAGSIERTENQAKEMLVQGVPEVEVIYIDKTRVRSGEVADAKLSHIFRCGLSDDNKKIIKTELMKEDIDFNKACVLFFVDDMIDTGSTAGKDIALVKSYFQNSKFTIFIATHPVFSQGIGEALSRIGADLYIVGNTLSTDRFKNYKNIISVDLGPTIAKGLSGPGGN